MTTEQTQTKPPRNLTLREKIDVNDLIARKFKVGYIAIRLGIEEAAIVQYLETKPKGK